MSMADCLFCRIVAGVIPCQKVWESAECLAFRDIHPKAPTHVLIIPKQHYATLHDLPTNAPIAAALLDAIVTVARQCGITESGYRVIANTNRDGGQEVFHVHFHLLGGRPLGRMLSHD